MIIFRRRPTSVAPQCSSSITLRRRLQPFKPCLYFCHAHEPAHSDFKRRYLSRVEHFIEFCATYASHCRALRGRDGEPFSSGVVGFEGIGGHWQPPAFPLERRRPGTFTCPEKPAPISRVFGISGSGKPKNPTEILRSSPQLRGRVNGFRSFCTQALACLRLTIAVEQA